MDDMQKLRKKHQELKEFIAEKQEMDRVRNLFLNQVIGNTKKATHMPPRLRTKEQPKIQVYEVEGIKEMRQRPRPSNKYNLINVLEMMK